MSMLSVHETHEVVFVCMSGWGEMNGGGGLYSLLDLW